MKKLTTAGVLDVFMTPIQMIKNRPGTQLNVLCQEQDSTLVWEILFSETSVVDTPFGSVRIKIVHLLHGDIIVAPEYEDPRKLATDFGVALREIYSAVDCCY